MDNFKKIYFSIILEEIDTDKFPKPFDLYFKNLKSSISLAAGEFSDITAINTEVLVWKNQIINELEIQKDNLTRKNFDKINEILSKLMKVYEKYI